MKIALFVKESLETSDELSTLLISKINEYDFEFDQDDPDVVIVVGGDGTLLRAVHEYFPSLNKVSFVGVNQGNLGFACDYQINEINDLFIDLTNHTYDETWMPLLSAKIGEDKIYALNEIRIENPFHTLISDIYIDGEKLETFRGNGLVVSSSFGSSGYNKSLGGAVIPTNLSLMQLKEIAPITNRVYQSLNSPLILSDQTTIHFDGEFQGCILGYDHLSVPVENLKTIEISCTDIFAKILYKESHSYIKQLKEAFVK